MVGLFCAYRLLPWLSPRDGFLALVGILGRVSHPKGFLSQARGQGQPALYGLGTDRHLVHQYE